MTVTDVYMMVVNMYMSVLLVRHENVGFAFLFQCYLNECFINVSYEYNGYKFIYI